MTNATRRASVDGRRAPVKRERSPARIERSEATRNRILEVAAKLIGRTGYAGCSIARITARAGVAHGAFYQHFESQQQLFDEILPTLGSVMLGEISNAVHDSTGILELERRGLIANFEYLKRKPYMYRVLREAKVYSPKAFARHFDDLAARYARSLDRSLRADQISDFSTNDLGVLAAMLIGARDQILERYCAEGRRIRSLPKNVIDAYLRFVAQGLGVRQ
jgi:AcrR family transcriptional regulator